MEKNNFYLDNLIYEAIRKELNEIDGRTAAAAARSVLKRNGNDNEEIGISRLRKGQNDKDFERYKKFKTYAEDKFGQEIGNKKKPTMLQE